MSRQDRHGVRTPADVERKYNLGKMRSDIERLLKFLGLGAERETPPEILDYLVPVGSIVLRDSDPGTAYAGTEWTAVENLNYGWMRTK